MLKKPIASVVLPVYNAEHTIERAIDSILAQSLFNYEIIVINDGSIDGTKSKLEKYTDRRMTVLHEDHNGLVASLNKGILTAKGKYIARMDADDQAEPERLTRQIDYMEANPNVAVLGSATKIIYENGKECVRHRPNSHEEIRKNIVRINPFTHSSTVIRKSVLIKVGLYNEHPYEDYELWIRILQSGYKLANLSEVLSVYYNTRGSEIGKRKLRRRLLDQLNMRRAIIKQLELGYGAYLDIVMVIAMSILNYYGLRIDRFFSIISNKGASKSNS